MIKILCVGKITEKSLLELQNDYKKRISKYTNIEIIQVKDSKIDDIKVVLEQEKNLLLKYISKKDYIITLEIEGDSISSMEFSEKINRIQFSNPNITFIVGGSNGLHDDIKKLSNYKLSFSRLTFPHQLFRIILLEQIYRCFKILNNETYHK